MDARFFANGRVGAVTAGKRMIFGSRNKVEVFSSSDLKHIAIALNKKLV